MNDDRNKDNRVHRSRWGDFGAMWNAIRGRRPNCGGDGVFESLWGVAETCPTCGVRFERESGAWLGAWVMAYTVAVLILAVEALLLIWAFGLFQGLEWVLVVSGIAAVLLLYRPIKGWWLWWMWAAGFIHEDEGPAEDEEPEAG